MALLIVHTGSVHTFTNRRFEHRKRGTSMYLAGKQRVVTALWVGVHVEDAARAGEDGVRGLHRRRLVLAAGGVGGLGLRLQLDAPGCLEGHLGGVGLGGGVVRGGGLLEAPLLALPVHLLPEGGHVHSIVRQVWHVYT